MDLYLKKDFVQFTGRYLFFYVHLLFKILYFVNFKMMLIFYDHFAILYFLEQGDTTIVSIIYYIKVVTNIRFKT